MEITSLTNTKVKQWAKYKEKKYRELDHKFLIEGEHLIQEAHLAGCIECILVEQEEDCFLHAYPIYEVTSDILKKLSDSVSGTTIMAVCNYPNAVSEVGSKIILLDDVQDPGNVGTIIRTALSFGYDTVILSNHCADVYNEKVIRSTQGAIFHQPFIRGDLKAIIPDLQAKGIHIYATALKGAKPLQDTKITSPFAIIFGNEGSGVHQEILEMSDDRVYIEMDTFESLNVAIAAGICMYVCKNK